MEKCYSSDLSDGEWERLESQVPTSEDDREPAAPARSSTPSSTSCGAAALGGCCPRASRPGRPSTVGSGCGAQTGPSSGSTPRYAGGCGPARAGTRSRARVSPTPSRPRPQGSAESTEGIRREQEGEGQKA